MNPSETLNQYKTFQLREIGYDGVLENIVNVVNWNDHIDIRNFLKFEEDGCIRWFGLWDSSTEEYVAYWGVHTDYKTSDGKKLYKGTYLMAKSGHGYGILLVKMLVDYLKEEDNKKRAWTGMAPKTNVYDGVEIIADPTAKVSLAGYYLYHLNRFTGWDVTAEKNEFWTTVKFTHLFR